MKYSPLLPFLFLTAFVSACQSPAPKPIVQYNVRDYGATGTDIAKDTAAFQKALDTCAANGGGEVVVPAGNYTIGSVVMKSETTLRLEKGVFIIESPNSEDYPVIPGKFEGAKTNVRRSLIYAENARNIAIKGPGGFVANSVLGFPRNPRAPNVIEPVECTNVMLDGFSIQYDTPPAGQNRVVWCIHPMYCTNLTAQNLFIRSPLTNGDGLDIDSCKDVLIQYCDISAGDDAIALKSGRGMDAVRTARPTENVIIRNCTLASPRYAAIGFGTELSGGLRNITVSQCTLSGRQNAIFMKSRDGRGGFIENVVIEKITVNNSPNIVGIDLMSKGIAGVEPVQGDAEKWTKMSNITIRDVTVNEVGSLVEVQRSSAGPGIPPNRMLDGLTIANIRGTARKGFTLTNIRDAKVSDINVFGYTGDLFTLNDVTGTGLDNPPAPRPAQ